MPVDYSNSLDDQFSEIMDRYKLASDAWCDIFTEFVADLRFANLDQWDPVVKAAREKAGLSTLVYDQINSKIDFVVNNSRANTPQIKTSPVDNGAKKNTARVFDGLMKHIQYKSDARQAYTNAMKTMTTGGLGAWRISPVQTSDGEYDISLDRILDPTSIVIDPASNKQMFQDAEYCFILTPLTKAQFERDYPDEEPDSVKQVSGNAADRDTVWLLEYWCKNLETGYWEQHILSGSKILSSNTAYRGKYMPIAFLTGEETHIEGERHYRGIVRNVKDMQILLNMAQSRTADYITKSASGQWLASADQISDYASFWHSADINGIPVLPYSPTGGPPPQRIEPPAPPVGFQSVAADADAAIRSSIGIRDPLQDIPASQSGKAIALQISQSNIGTYAYMDKLNAAIKYTGEVLLDLIPQYFSYPHVREIMGIDNQLSTIPLNEPYEENGEMVMHNLAQGRYTVTISDGPSYESQRSEAADTLMEMVKTYPQFLQIAGDILFRNRNFDGADEIADRLRAQIPPEVLAASNPTNADDKQRLAMAFAQANQMQQAINQLQAQLQQATNMVQQLQQEKAAGIAKIQAQGQVDTSLSNLKFEHDMTLKGVEINGKSELAQQTGEQTARLHMLDAHANVFSRQMDHTLSREPRTPVEINIDLANQ